MDRLPSQQHSQPGSQLGNHLDIIEASRAHELLMIRERIKLAELEVRQKELDVRLRELELALLKARADEVSTAAASNVQAVSGASASVDQDTSAGDNGEIISRLANWIRKQPPAPYEECKIYNTICQRENPGVEDSLIIAVASELGYRCGQMHVPSRITTVYCHD
jgi:hypothetical protein